MFLWSTQFMLTLVTFFELLITLLVPFFQCINLNELQKWGWLHVFHAHIRIKKTFPRHFQSSVVPCQIVSVMKEELWIKNGTVQGQDYLPLNSSDQNELLSWQSLALHSFQFGNTQWTPMMPHQNSKKIDPSCNMNNEHGLQLIFIIWNSIL